MENLELMKISKNVRMNIIKMLGQSKSGHPGGSLSMADILTVLYFDEMKIDPKDSTWDGRDRFVLSKGHGAPALYSILSEVGYIEESALSTLRKINSPLQGHPDMRKVKGVEMSTGSLGQGFSSAVGMAISFKISGASNRVYSILGDGECQEGIVWESAMAAAHYKLDNLTIFVDNNGLQIDGPCEQVMNVNSLSDKFKAFGFNVLEIDGHNLDEIKNSLKEAKEFKNKPTAIIAKTVKGKGVSFMENQCSWHGVAPSAEEVEQAIKELEAM